MGQGLHHSGVAYVWPAALFRPVATKLVYLDLNHWIALAKAATGHPAGSRHKESLEALRSARSSGRILLPLSGTHYMEMYAIRDPRQRADLAAVMEELSGFAALLCRSVLIRLELEATLDALAGPRADPYLPVLLIGRGVGHAFGMRGGLRIRSPEGDVTEKTRLEWSGGPKEFDRWLAAAELTLERALLAGPSDADVPELERDGWDPTAARCEQERRAEQEREQALRLDATPRWRRGRLRDVVSARYVAIELMDMLNDGLQARGVVLDDVSTDLSAARGIVDAMPSGDVCLTLTTAAHRNRERPWSANDISDIDALSIAVPYCDLVATERHACHVLNATGVVERLGTTVVATLDELLSAL
jgi:hypothetical protein